MVRVTIKALGRQFTTEFEKDILVRELKQMIADKAEIPANAQRLIYKGRVMKDEELVLEKYGIEEGSTIHLLRGSGVTNTSTNITQSSTARQEGSIPTNPNLLGSSLFGGSNDMLGMQEQLQQQLMNNPEALSAAMNSPMTRAIMENPDSMRMIMESNPRLRGVLENNPQLRHALNDPNLLREAMEVARSPARLREAMRHQDLAISNVESHPEGFNALRRMYQDVQAPLYDGMDASSMGAGNSNQAVARIPLAPDAPAGALPNPWAPPSSAIPGAPQLPPQGGSGTPSFFPPAGGIPPGLEALLGGGPAPFGQNYPLDQFLRQPPATQPAPIRPNPWAHLQTSNSSSAPAATPATPNEDTISQLIDLGFADRSANERALVRFLKKILF